VCSYQLHRLACLYPMMGSMFMIYAVVAEQAFNWLRHTELAASKEKLELAACYEFNFLGHAAASTHPLPSHSEGVVDERNPKCQSQ